MEDGSTLPILGLLMLFLLLWVDGIFYGFAAAVRNISENEIMKKAAEGDKKARLLKELLDEPFQYVNAIPLIVITSGICTGVFLVPWMRSLFVPYIKRFPVLVPVLIFCVIFFASFEVCCGALATQQYPSKDHKSTKTKLPKGRRKAA